MIYSKQYLYLHLIKCIKNNIYIEYKNIKCIINMKCISTIPNALKL